VVDAFVRDYEDGDEVVLRALFADAFGTDRSVEAWHWWNFEGPGGQPFIRVLVAEGEVVGHLGNVYFSTFLGSGRLGRVSQGGDLMIRRDWRGRGLHPLLSLYGSANEPDYDVKLSFPIDKVRDRIQTREADAVMPGTLPQWVRWHPVARVASLVGGRGSFTTVEAPGPEFDTLAASSSSFAPCLRVRDAAYVKWRWLENPNGRWTVTALRRPGDGSLLGWVVYGHHSLEPASRGRIVDLLAPDFGTARRLLLHAGAALHAGGSSVVTMELLDPRPWMRRACLAAGYLERGIGPNIALRKIRPELRSVAADIGNWYLTMGDTDLV
jgi:hypothetical protein